MRLVIDTRNGLAGDIMAAGLIGLGADAVAVTEVMESAGNLLGPCKVTHSSAGGVHRLGVTIEPKPDHLHASQAREYLVSALEKARVEPPWRDMGLRALEALIGAESHVHSVHPVLSRHFHGHEPVLHEASDIIVDITGMATGMMSLGITEVDYVDHVNVGGGKIKFSHGTLDVPTPATRHILDSHGIPWRNSDCGMEAATPTGASMLAGCRARRVAGAPDNCRKALAGGTRPLAPIAFLLCE